VLTDMTLACSATQKHPDNITYFRPACGHEKLHIIFIPLNIFGKFAFFYIYKKG